MQDLRLMLMSVQGT